MAEFTDLEPRFEFEADFTSITVPKFTLGAPPPTGGPVDYETCINLPTIDGVPFKGDHESLKTLSIEDTVRMWNDAFSN